MKRMILSIFAIPLLLACNNKNESPKISLEKVDNPGMEVVNGKHMFDNAFTNKTNSIYYIGDDSCSSCQALKPKVQEWCVNNNARVYEIVLTEMTPEDLTYIQDSTVGYYVWKDEDVVPTVYFFMEGEVVTRTSSDNTIKYLNKYVEVK